MSGSNSVTRSIGPTTADEASRGRELLAIADARARGDNEAADRMQARMDILDQAKREAAQARSVEEIQSIELEAKRKIAELEQKHQRELYELQASAEAARLRSIGKFSEAELVEFDARSKAKIEMAQTEAEKLIQIEIWRLERIALENKEADEQAKRFGTMDDEDSAGAAYSDLEQPTLNKGRGKRRTMSGLFGGVKPGKRNPWSSNIFGSDRKRGKRNPWKSSLSDIFKTPRKDNRRKMFHDIFGSTSEMARSTLAGAQSAIQALPAVNPNINVQPINEEKLAAIIAQNLTPILDQRIGTYAAAARAAQSIMESQGSL